jgi:hypothetical protein
MQAPTESMVHDVLEKRTSLWDTLTRLAGNAQFTENAYRYDKTIDHVIKSTKYWIERGLNLNFQLNYLPYAQYCGSRYYNQIAEWQFSKHYGIGHY